MPIIASAQLLTESDSPETEPPSPLPVIEAEASRQTSDTAIEQRLNGIYSNLETMSAVTADVDDGVAVLSGVVTSQEAYDRAEELAQRVSGTVAVLNTIKKDRSVESRLKVATSALLEQFQDLVTLGPLLILAAVIIGLSVLLARVVVKAEWLFARLSSNWFLRDLWRQLLQIAIVAAGILIALNLLDWTALLGSVVGALGIVGLAIGFATRDTVENYIASILLSVRQPFSREDYIKLGDIEGKVIRLTPRATILMSLDGNHLRIPNSTVFKATIENFTRNPLRRFQFTVGVDTDLDLAEPRKTALETLNMIPGVLQSPSPLCLVQSLGDSSVILNIQGWIDQRESDFNKTISEAQRLVKEAFDDAGIVMPEPIYNVNLRRSKPKIVAGELSRRASAEHTTPDQQQTREDAATEVTDDMADTSRDQTLEKQIRADKQAAPADDLLDESAPRE